MEQFGNKFICLEVEARGDRGRREVGRVRGEEGGSRGDGGQGGRGEGQEDGVGARGGREAAAPGQADAHAVEYHRPHRRQVG